MSLDLLLQNDVQKFVKAHERSDITTLALKKLPNPSWDYNLILDQIKVRQKAKIKSPDLHEIDNIIFPKNDLYEQASSSACAAYKASLVKGLSFIDLTSGSGIDSYYISKNFKNGTLVERDNYHAALLKHNMKILRQEKKIFCELTIYNGDATQYLNNIDINNNKIDLVFIDPQRRENNKKGIFELSSCSPDILSLLPVLKNKVKNIIVKTSPVLDIEKAIKALKYVTKVHIVQWNNECKEVLYYLDTSSSINPDEVIIHAVDIDDTGSIKKQFSYKKSDEKHISIKYSMPLTYLYEPSAAFQKSGGFKSLAIKFDVKKIHPHSHIYTSDNIRDKFPGKYYEIIDITPVKAKALNIKKADLTLRNFPGNVHELKKKLKLLDGGDYRIFATTLCNNEKKLIICNKFV